MLIVFHCVQHLFFVSEKSFCYIEGSLVDKNTAEEISELHENVWYRMKPPKKSSSSYAPFVSARQIDLVRTLLMGKRQFKFSDVKMESISDEDGTTELPKPEPPTEMSINKRKSSVRFLSKSIYID
ncbi:hypothetical protein BDFB_000708 [Asbolus verrucosus]|uniref:Uncharacterized protein n=1 Tax=Asbolus verrucosus TaxID=1661398 RepID=A0A482VI38_ASBVE|nr:hypothetical protein BDFB_000708 [Asbolus verrucosus]